MLAPERRAVLTANDIGCYDDAARFDEPVCTAIRGFIEDLADARLVVDKAIEVGGWDAYFYSLLEVTGVLHVSNVTKIYKAITLAAAEQETRAALAVIEAKGGNDGMG